MSQTGGLFQNMNLFQYIATWIYHHHLQQCEQAGHKGKQNTILILRVFSLYIYTFGVLSN